MSQWTKEPWLVANGDNGIIVKDGEWERHICSHGRGGNDKDFIAEGQANMRRIVACVNGCAGLNPAAYRECVAALKTLSDEIKNLITEHTLPLDALLHPSMTKAHAALTHAEAQATPKENP